MGSVSSTSPACYQDNPGLAGCKRSINGCEECSPAPFIKVRSLKEALIEKCGISLSKNGHIIANKANMRRLERYILDHCKSATGSEFDGMVDGHSNVDHSIQSALEVAWNVINNDRYGRGIYATDDAQHSQPRISIGDCCYDVAFHM